MVEPSSNESPAPGAPVATPHARWRRALPGHVGVDTGVRRRRTIRRWLLAWAAISLTGLGILLWMSWPRGTVVASSRDTAIGRGRNVVWSSEPVSLDARFPWSIPALTDPVVFEPGPLPFVGRRSVQGFGGEERDDRGKSLEQVRLHWRDDPLSPREFVLELRPETPDRIFLARLAPGATLADTWEIVATRLTDPPKPLPKFERLAIPKIAVDRAGLRFLLTESGPKETDANRILTSWRSRPASLSSSPPDPSFVFDGPFLVAVLRDGKTEPYLLLWVGNGDLLVGVP